MEEITVDEDLEALSPNDRFLTATRFLNREAQLLDDRDLTAWVDLFAEDATYKMPVRVTVERDSERAFSPVAFHFDEDKDTLETRVERFHTEHAWAEDPPSRTRHLVTNVRVMETRGDEMDVRSNVLVSKARGDRTDADFLLGERHDTLRAADGTLEVAKRTIYLDQTTLNVDSLSIFL